MSIRIAIAIAIAIAIVTASSACAPCAPALENWDAFLADASLNSGGPALLTAIAGDRLTFSVDIGDVGGDTQEVVMTVPGVAASQQVGDTGHLRATENFAVWSDDDGVLRFEVDAGRSRPSGSLFAVESTAGIATCDVIATVSYDGVVLDVGHNEVVVDDHVYDVVLGQAVHRVGDELDGAVFIEAYALLVPSSS